MKKGTAKGIRDDSKGLLKYLVVSTLFKNISQNGNLPQVRVKIKDIWNRHLDTLRIQTPPDFS